MRSIESPRTEYLGWLLKKRVKNTDSLEACFQITIFRIKSKSHVTHLNVLHIQNAKSSLVQRH